MKRIWQILFIGSIVLTSPLLSWAERVDKSSSEDQQAVEATVYNSNIALIKDTRKINLSKGTGELRFMDVAAYIMPVTVHIKSLDAPQKFSVLEQNYEYDLISPQKLMNKYVGKNVKLLNINPYNNTKETLDAKLLSINEGEVYKINNEIYLGYPGYRILPEIPENLIAQPTLTWLYQNSAANAQRLEVSYLTQNLSWKADYVLTVNDKDTFADLSGWVTLDNKSGATYKDAKLKLVAGQINRVMGEVDQMYNARRADMAMEMKAASPFNESSFFEYHIYDLDRKTTIKDNQTKQVSLLEATGAKVGKEYLVQGNSYYFYGQYPNQDLKTPVNVMLKFKNAKENNLGMPLPAGTMRLYKADNTGSLQFIGEDMIKHTPKDEEVKLKIGEAFDIVAERKQLNFQILSSGHLYESQWEVTLRNHKEEDVVIGVVEPMTSDWQITESTHSFQKIDAFTARFDVPVAKNGEVKLKYTMRVKY